MIKHKQKEIKTYKEKYNNLPRMTQDRFGKLVFIVVLPACEEPYTSTLCKSTNGAKIIAYLCT